MGALEAPQDKHGQEPRTGTSRAEQTTETMAELGALEAMAELGALEAMVVQGAQEAMAVQGAQEAMADGFRGLGLGPLGPAPTAGTLTTPPPKNFPGEVRGYQETRQDRKDSTRQLNRQDSTKQDRKALQGQTDRTGQPTGKGSPPGLARRLRLLLGMTRSQRPTQGPSVTASTSATRGQAAGNGLHGHYRAPFTLHVGPGKLPENCQSAFCVNANTSRD